MFEKRCYLCGGKLAGGRCIDCGLDNTRNEKKTYRLNQGSSSRASKERSRIESTWGQRDKSDGSSKSSGRHSYEKDVQHSDYRMNTAPASKYKGRTGGFTTFSSLNKKAAASPDMMNIWKAVGIMIVSVIIVAGLVFNMASEHEEEVSSDYTYEADVEEDPYMFAARELSADGSEFRTVLEPGEYQVGVHLPEGNYQVFLEEGSGTVSVDDYENSIYLWQGIGTEEEYDELREWIDVRLYQGAVVEVSGNLRVKLSTDNAQDDSMEVTKANPLTETILLKNDTELTAGIDFPAGVYDLMSGGEWSHVHYKIPLYTDYEDEEMNFLSRSRFVSSDEIDSVYHNIVLPEGTKISAEEADVLLSPSDMIKTEDYDAYYDEYR